MPTEDPAFYNTKLAGQGYPFDNLQISSIWVGTSLYVICQSKDRRWSFVITPDVIAWVPSISLAYTDKKFISTWQAAAKNKLIAITHTHTNIFTNNNELLFTTYVGTVFPQNKRNKLLVPTKNTQQMANITAAQTDAHNITAMPEQAKPHSFANIVSSLVGRPYGWGNLYFYNDCSAELKNIFTVFGIWLPRHSSDQMTIGKMVDISSRSMQQRLNYLMENGHKLSTIVYIGGHVFLYIGNYPNPNTANHEQIAMTYQNLWSLSPKPPNRRAIIGQAVFFPLLSQYPEDSRLVSLANKKFFQVSDLNNLSLTLNQIIQINLENLMLSFT